MGNRVLSLAASMSVSKRLTAGVREYLKTAVKHRNYLVSYLRKWFFKSPTRFYF